MIQADVVRSPVGGNDHEMHADGILGLAPHHSAMFAGPFIPRPSRRGRTFLSHFFQQHRDLKRQLIFDLGGGGPTSTTSVLSSSVGSSREGGQYRSKELLTPPNTHQEEHAPSPPPRLLFGDPPSMPPSKFGKNYFTDGTDFWVTSLWRLGYAVTK